MKNILLMTRKMGRVTRNWVATGNPRMPLGCVWTQAEFPFAEASAADEAGGMPRCA
jgi:hypothetical protein